MNHKMLALAWDTEGKAKRERHDGQLEDLRNYTKRLRELIVEEHEMGFWAKVWRWIK